MSGTTRRKPGWMGPYIESLRAWLLERGYTPGSIKHVLTLAGQLGRWMQSSDVKFSQLDSVAVESFLGAGRAAGSGSAWPSTASRLFGQRGSVGV